MFRATVCSNLLQVKVIEEIHYILTASIEVSLVVLIGDVPTEGAKLPPLLYSGVEEGNRVEHGLPLRQVGVVQLFLGDASEGPLDACLHSLWWLKCVLDGSLEQVDGVLGMYFCGQPQPECVMDSFCLLNCGQKFHQKVQAEVSVLQKSPSSLQSPNNNSITSDVLLYINLVLLPASVTVVRVVWHAPLALGPLIQIQMLI